MFSLRSCRSFLENPEVVFLVHLFWTEIAKKKKKKYGDGVDDLDFVIEKTTNHQVLKRNTN